MNKQQLIESLMAEGYDEDEARKRVESLDESIRQNGGVFEEVMSSARSWLHDLKVTVNSIVGSPAMPSDWTILKSDGSVVPLLLRKDMSKEQDEQMIAFAPALIPGIIDKQGDILDPIAIERAANLFLTEHGEIDTEHQLNLGQGEVVQSWTTKVVEDYEMPDGSKKSYPIGTWMLGIKCKPDVWADIKSGRYYGLSIFGQGTNLRLKAKDDGTVARFTISLDVEDPQAYREWLEDELSGDALKQRFRAKSCDRIIKDENHNRSSDNVSKEEIKEEEQTEETPVPEPEAEAKGASNEDVMEAIKELGKTLSDAMGEIKSALTKEPEEDEEDDDEEEDKSKSETEDKGEPVTKAQFSEPPVEDRNRQKTDPMDYDSIAKSATEDRDRAWSE